MNIDIDSAIFIGFLLINLAVGLKYGTKLKTIQDFALGGRSFNTSSIVATLVATWISGSFLFVSLAKIYSEGITLIVAYLFCSSIFLTMGYIFIPRMREFLGNLSIAGSMGSIYGKEVEVITAVTGAISCLGMVAVQFKIFGTALNFFFDLDDTLAVIIGSLIVILYSSFGGIRSVTITDIVQFITFSVFIPIILFLLIKVVDLDHVYNTVQYTHFADFKKLFDYSHPNFFNFITLLFYFSFPNFPPEIFQRVLIAKNIKQVQKSFYLAFVICLSIISATIFMAILLFYINPNLEPNKIFHFIVENYLYSGIKGLAIVGLIAMIMSTADSNINSSAILLTDFFRSFKMTSPEFELIIARAFSVILGVIAIILALSKTDLLSIILSTASFYMPIVNIPLMLAILGFRSTKKAVLIGMGAGFITVISSYFIDISIDIIIPAMAINLIFFMGSHYLLKQEGGWVGIKDKSPLEEIQRDRKKKIDSILKSIQEFNLIKFCKSNSPKDDTTYSFFGIFCFVSTIATIYSTNNYSMNQHYDILLYIYESMLVISTCFMFYTIWSSRIKIDYVVGIAWNVSLIYMLTFCSTFFVLLSNFGKLQLIVFTLNLVVMFIITRWQVALTMIFLGLICSMQWYKYYMGIESLSIALGSGYFNLLYALLLVSTALITFLKPKQEYLEATEVKVGTLETEVSHLGHEVIDLNEQVTHYSEQVADKDKEIERLGATAQKILNNVNHELRLPIGNVVNFSEMLSETLGKSDNKLVKELSKEVYDNSNRASTMILNMLDLATLDVKKVDLQKTMINFSELVTDRVKTCRKIYLRDKKIDFELTIEPEVMIAVDPNYIRQTVDNLVINAINFSREGLIKVAVSKQKGQVMFTIIDQGKGIPELELSDIFRPFKMGSNSESKAQGRGVGLALCKSAVEAHGGTISADSNGEVGATLRFVLPL